MNPAHKPVVFIFAVFIAMSAIVGISRLRTGHDIIPWRTDFTAAQAESAQTGKPVFAYFTAEWCGPCQSLKRTTWSDKQVAEALDHYIPVKIDIDASKSLAQRYTIAAVPTFAILNPDGSVQVRTEGALDADDMLSWLGRAR